jgi:hypothetical protein
LLGGAKAYPVRLIVPDQGSRKIVAPFSGRRRGWGDP